MNKIQGSMYHHEVTPEVEGTMRVLAQACSDGQPLMSDYMFGGIAFLQGTRVHKVEYRENSSYNEDIVGINRILNNYQHSAQLEYEITVSFDPSHAAPKPKLERLGIYTKLEELFRINRAIQATVAVAVKLAEEKEWKTTYHIVFNRDMSTRVNELLSELNMRIEWTDYGTSYEEEVCTYASVLDEFCKTLTAFAETEDKEQQS